jgi:hypothetical protein
MKQRTKVSGERAKSRSLKATKRKRSSASDKAPSSASPHASAQAELARLTRELTDERRQRMATSEVLRLLSGSHGDLNHFFGTILANATNLCQANFGTLSLCEGDAFHIVEMHNVPPGLGELRRRFGPSSCRQASVSCDSAAAPRRAGRSLTIADNASLSLQLGAW